MNLLYLRPDDIWRAAPARTLAERVYKGRLEDDTEFDCRGGIWTGRSWARIMRRSAEKIAEARENPSWQGLETYTVKCLKKWALSTGLTICSTETYSSGFGYDFIPDAVAERDEIPYSVFECKFVSNLDRRHILQAFTYSVLLNCPAMVVIDAYTTAVSPTVDAFRQALGVGIWPLAYSRR